MLRIVLEIIKDKNDFENIFKKLKNESRTNKNISGVSTKDRAITREIVVSAVQISTTLVDRRSRCSVLISSSMSS